MVDQSFTYVHMNHIELVPCSKEIKKEGLSDMKRKLLPFALWCSRGKALNVWLCDTGGGLFLIH